MRGCSEKSRSAFQRAQSPRIQLHLINQRRILAGSAGAGLTRRYDAAAPPLSRLPKVRPHPGPSHLKDRPRIHPTPAVCDTLDRKRTIFRSPAGSLAVFHVLMLPRRRSVNVGSCGALECRIYDGFEERGGIEESLIVCLASSCVRKSWSEYFWMILLMCFFGVM